MHASGLYYESLRLTAVFRASRVQKVPFTAGSSGGDGRVVSSCSSLGWYSLVLILIVLQVSVETCEHHTRLVVRTGGADR